MPIALVFNRRQKALEESPAFAHVAERFRRAGDLQRAVSLCRDGLRLFPEHVSARVTFGLALLDLGEHAAARVELRQALERAPDNLAAIRGMAALHDHGEADLTHEDWMHAHVEADTPAAAPAATHPDPSPPAVVAHAPAKEDAFVTDLANLADSDVSQGPDFSEIPDLPDIPEFSRPRLVSDATLAAPPARAASFALEDFLDDVPELDEPFVAAAAPAVEGVHPRLDRRVVALERFLGQVRTRQLVVDGPRVAVGPADLRQAQVTRLLPS
jgi:tetratricopeptide (TPR) repeat protein